MGVGATFSKLSNRQTATYTYDNNGNLIGKVDASGSWQYQWDYENRLVQVIKPRDASSLSYRYDAMGKR
jgi:YD repeat-containing protein